MMPWSQQDVERLQTLGLPDLAGKSVLDLDCGSGLICAFAVYAGASRVCGWSTDAEAITRAQKLLPEAHFSCRNWQDLLHDLPEGQTGEQYDYIIVPHSIRHGRALADNLARLMARISPWGTLILETLLVTGQTEEGFFKLGKDPNLYPSSSTFCAMLEPWVWRHVHQEEFCEMPMVCNVYHIAHPKPEAIVFMGDPFSGKSNLSQLLESKDMPRIHGDVFLRAIQCGNAWAPEPLVAFLQEADKATNHYVLIWMICMANLLEEYIQALDRKANGRPFIFDGYIPEKYHDIALKSLDSKGYFVTNTDIVSARLHNRRPLALEKHEDAFSLFLLKHFKGALTHPQQD